MNRRTLHRILLLLAVVALLALGWRGFNARQAARQSQLATPKVLVVELRSADLARAEQRELDNTLPIAGTLKAVRSAMVKARVPGELQGLTVREGDNVSAGQVIARVEPIEYNERLHQAERQVDAARAQSEIAQRQFDNNRALVDQGFISRTALDTSAASLNAALANVRAAQAGVEIARKAVADTVLRAPIAGQIAQRLAQPGERVSPDTRIVEIVDPSELELEIPLSPADSVPVRVGQRATLTVEGTSEPVAAAVARINPSAQPGSRSVMVYLTVASIPGLRQGLFAQGELAIARASVLAVPLSTVRNDKSQPYVQVIEGSGEQTRVLHRPVTLGARASADGDTLVAITSGLTAGERILRGSAGSLQNGTLVRVVDAAAS